MQVLLYYKHWSLVYFIILYNICFVLKILSGLLVIGHYIPQLSQAIVKHNQASGENTINLKGYMVSLSSLSIHVCLSVEKV